MPEPYWSAASAGLAGLFFARLTQDGLAGEADLVALDSQHLDQHLVAQLQLIANVADALFGDFADVEQAVGARENFDEGAEVREAHDLTEISLADLG